MCMTTFTNARTCPPVNYDLEGVRRTLADDGLVLMPTDTLWSVGCDARSIVAIKRQARLTGHREAPPAEVLIESIHMLKDYVKHLHPRLETLLHYHTRPLTFLLDPNHRLPADLHGPDGLVAFRVAQDDFCCALLRSHGRPVAVRPAGDGQGEMPATFGAINSNIIEGVDHVVRYRQSDKSPGEESVMVQLSRKGELIFLRE